MHKKDLYLELLLGSATISLPGEIPEICINLLLHSESIQLDANREEHHGGQAMRIV